MKGSRLKSVLIVCLILIGCTAKIDVAKEYGKGVKAYSRKDYKTALQTFQRLAEKTGYANAQYRLGEMYAKGQGVSQDYEEAFKWIQQAATQHHPYAQYQLGVLYEDGQGISQNRDEAVKWYQAAANQCNIQATSKLAQMARPYYDAEHKTGRNFDQEYATGISAYKEGQYQAALQKFQFLAEQGHADAQYRLGDMYATGMGGVVPKDDTEAVKWFQKAAEQHHVQAQSQLRYISANGQKGESKPTETPPQIVLTVDQQYETGVAAYEHGEYQTAFQTFESLAEQRYLPAQYRLGEIYMKGIAGIIGQDERAALMWFAKAAEQGYALAQYQIGCMYAQGQGVAQNDEEAFVWYQLAANQGNTLAQDKLESLLQQTSAPILRNAAEAETLQIQYEQGLAAYKQGQYQAALEQFRFLAEQGYADAQYRLGSMYAMGMGGVVPKDDLEAVKWFKKAAIQQHVQARSQLGVLYANGQSQATFQIFQWLAEQGYAPAQYRLGEMFVNGQGIAQDDRKAAEWFNNAAEQNYNDAQAQLRKIHEKIYGIGIAASASGQSQISFETFLYLAEQGYAPAQYRLGNMYAKGQGVWRNDSEAITWFKKAAEQNYHQAQAQLRKIYEKIYGVGIAALTRGQSQSAFETFNYLAEQDYAPAQYRLGDMYAKGVEGIISKDEAEAFKWFQKAAEHGHPAAEYQIGLRYEQGQGVEQSYQEAFRWYQLAADQGNTIAKAKLDQIASNLQKSTTPMPINTTQVEATQELWMDQFFPAFLTAWQNHDVQQARQLVTNNPLSARQMYQRLIEISQSDGENAKTSRAMVSFLEQFPIVRTLAQAEPPLKQTGKVTTLQQEIKQQEAYKVGIIAYKQGAYKIAFETFYPLAEQGYADAQYRLGDMYTNGMGGVVPKDNIEAFKWFKKAAEQNHIQAQLQLSYMYANGQGVKQNVDEAKRWYQAATTQGDTLAKERLLAQVAQSKREVTSSTQSERTEEISEASFRKELNTVWKNPDSKYFEQLVAQNPYTANQVY
jgi:TPR repeat protein